MGESTETTNSSKRELEEDSDWTPDDDKVQNRRKRRRTQTDQAGRGRKKRRKIEDGEIENECNICHKGFYSNCELKLHQIRIHSEEEPQFECDHEHCSKRFYLKGDLVKHRRVHSNESFECNLC